MGESIINDPFTKHKQKLLNYVLRGEIHRIHGIFFLQVYDVWTLNQMDK